LNNQYSCWGDIVTTDPYPTPTGLELGTKTAHRVSDIQGLDFLKYLSGDAQYYYQSEFAGITSSVSKTIRKSGKGMHCFLLIFSTENLSVWLHCWDLSN